MKQRSLHFTPEKLFLANQLRTSKGKLNPFWVSTMLNCTREASPFTTISSPLNNSQKGSELLGVVIVTDSTADLPDGIADELNIAVVPLKVHFGQEEYLDWIDLDSDSFFTKLKKSEVAPRTSQPAPADFESVYKSIAHEGDSINSIHLSSH